MLFIRKSTHDATGALPPSSKETGIQTTTKGRAVRNAVSGFCGWPHESASEGYTRWPTGKVKTTTLSRSTGLLEPYEFMTCGLTRVRWLQDQHLHEKQGCILPRKWPARHDMVARLESWCTHGGRVVGAFNTSSTATTEDVSQSEGHTTFGLEEETLA